MSRKRTLKEEWQKEGTLLFDIYSFNQEEQIIKDPSFVTRREGNQRRRGLS